jgi:hypothetical protein
MNLKKVKKNLPKGFRYVGHTKSGTAIKNSIDAYWDRTTIFPVPKFKVKCPQCETDLPQNILLKHWSYFQKDDVRVAERAHRCDVYFKCMRCSSVFWFGVNVSQETWLAADGQEGSQALWTFRDALKYLYEVSKGNLVVPHARVEKILPKNF